MFGVRWCKTGCKHGERCDGGGAYNPQKRIYALEVAIALAGHGDVSTGTTCHCGAPIHLWNGEVDRTRTGCYMPGVVVMTCHDCNNDRTHVAGFDVEAFASAVEIASQNVYPWRVTDARNFYMSGRNVGQTVFNSKFYRGV